MERNWMKQETQELLATMLIIERCPESLRLVNP